MALTQKWVGAVPLSAQCRYNLLDFVTIDLFIELKSIIKAKRLGILLYH
jgi:hypothetical protein